MLVAMQRGDDRCPSTLGLPSIHLSPLGSHEHTGCLACAYVHVYVYGCIKIDIYIIYRYSATQVKE